MTQVFEKPGATDNVITMTYDALGRVLTVAHSGKGTREVYQYRADGLRTVIDESLNGVAQKTRVQIYNDARQLVSQYEKTPSGSLTWKRDILYLGTKEAAEIDAAGMHVTHVDHLGSPRVVTGPTGAVEARQKYLPFGELLEQTGTLKTAKGYTNHEQTDSSGLIYMQARFYLPWYGRFASPDPARDQHFELTQSWNITSYVRNNPVMATDPTGMVAQMPDDEKVGTGLNVSTARSADNDLTGQMAAVTATEKKTSGQTGVKEYDLTGLTGDALKAAEKNIRAENPWFTGSLDRGDKDAKTYTGPVDIAITGGEYGPGATPSAAGAVELLAPQAQLRGQFVVYWVPPGSSSKDGLPTIQDQEMSHVQANSDAVANFNRDTKPVKLPVPAGNSPFRERADLAIQKYAIEASRSIVDIQNIRHEILDEN